MAALAKRLENIALRVLAPADALMNRLYGWRLNPLYHSGALAAALMAVVIVTGIYLIFFYRIGAPYESVVGLAEQAWLGRWIRTLHRYASDAAVVAIAIHVFRVFAQSRSWGPRALAWISGLVLLFVVLVCGWTGYVMVWDVQGIVLAREGARLLDAIPIFAEPIARAFVGERPIPEAFFFLNLFLHVALPIGLGVVLWIHVSRLARPALFPPKRLAWGVLALLIAVSVLWPAPMPPAADALRLPAPAAYDVFYSFWLPVTRALPVPVVWALGLLVTGLLLVVPRWTRPQRTAAPPSVVNERFCTGCRQCYLDCPYEAIAMVARPDGGEGSVARVNPALCVSCGICAASCAPMGVGPPQRTGRDQLTLVEEFTAGHRLDSREVVLVACSRGAGGATAGALFDGAPVFPVTCAGNLHTSVVEYLVRAGAGGVLIVACPARDCWNREGPNWLLERLYHDREAELKERVDRRRIRVAFAGLAEQALVRDELTRFRAHVIALEEVAGEDDIDLNLTCDPVPEEVGP
jgi:ferredoxin